MLSSVLLVFSACEKDDETLTAELSLNGVVQFEDGEDFDGDVNGDFTGTGGSDTRQFFWNNPLSTADYNADITAVTSGSFEMTVLDADGTIVFQRTLRGGEEPDSFSGVTASGTPGRWSVVITITSFRGDGSFSLSAGE